MNEKIYLIQMIGSYALGIYNLFMRYVQGQDLEFPPTFDIVASGIDILCTGLYGDKVKKSDLSTFTSTYV